MAYVKELVAHPRNTVGSHVHVHDTVRSPERSRGHMLCTLVSRAKRPSATRSIIVVPSFTHAPTSSPRTSGAISRNTLHTLSGTAPRPLDQRTPAQTADRLAVSSFLPVASFALVFLLCAFRFRRSCPRLRLLLWRPLSPTDSLPLAHPVDGRGSIFRSRASTTRRGARWMFHSIKADPCSADTRLG